MNKRFFLFFFSGAAALAFGVYFAMKNHEVDLLMQTLGEDGKRYKVELASYVESRGKTLGDIENYSSSKAREVAVGFSVSLGLDEKLYDSFYRCLGDKVMREAPATSVAIALRGCAVSNRENPELFKQRNSAYSYFDMMQGFSKINGSHTASVEAIKFSMHDPLSFEHDSTSFRLVHNPVDGLFLEVTTRFRGSNAFGAKVSQVVKTKVNPDSGVVLGVL